MAGLVSGSATPVIRTQRCKCKTDMPLTYLDQNAVIYLLEKVESDPAFRAKLDAAIASGKLTVVVSSWNLNIAS
jgi:hypothetical protein